MAKFSLQGQQEAMYRIFNFSGGLNNQYHDASLEENEASELINMVFEERGHIRKRPGMKIHPDFPQQPGVAVVHMMRFLPRDKVLTTFFLYEDGAMTIQRGQEVEALTCQNEEGDTISLSGKRFSHFSIHGFFYFGNSTDGWFKYAASPDDPEGEPAETGVATAVPTIPKCDYAVLKNTRAYYAGDPDVPHRLHYSHQGDPEDVSIEKQEDETDANVGGIIDVLSEEPDITGLSLFQGDILILKKDAAFTLQGDDFTDFYLRQLNVATGCTQPHTLTRGDNMVYYTGYDGVYFIYSTSQEVVETRPISDKITPEFDSLQGAHSIYYKSKFFLFCPDKTLIYDERLSAWTKWDLVITCALYADDIDELLLGGENGYIYTLDPNQLKDETAPGVYKGIHGSFTLPYLHFGKPEKTKRYKWIKLFFAPNPIEGSVIDLNITIDYTDQSKQLDIFYDSMVWEDDGDDEEDNLWGEYWGDMRKQIAKKVRFGGSGEYIKITFTNDQPDEQLGIFGITFGFKEKAKVR